MKKLWFALLTAILLCAGTTFAQNTLTDAEKAEGFVLLFDGKSLDKTIWEGAVDQHQVKDGLMIADPGGLMVTREEYANFIFRVEFCLPKSGNNGVGIRCQPQGSPGRTGMEVQILDDDAYPNLHPSQYTASLYGVIGPEKRLLKPVGEWNTLEIIADGPHVKTILNGETAVDADLSNWTHFPMNTPPSLLKPGVDKKSGRLAFAGHNSPVKFRNIRVKRLPDSQ